MEKEAEDEEEELDWQHERDDENEHGTVQCEGT